MSPSPIHSLESPSSQTIEELHASRKATGSLQEATLNTQVGQPPHAEQILEVRQSQPSHSPQGVSGGNPISSRTEDINDLVEELTCSALPLPPPSPLSPSLAGASSQNPIIIDSDDGTPPARRSPPSSPLRLLASGRLGSVRSEGLTMSATFPGESVDGIDAGLLLISSSFIQSHYAEGSCVYRCYTASRPVACSRAGFYRLPYTLRATLRAEPYGRPSALSPARRSRHTPHRRPTSVR